MTREEAIECNKNLRMYMELSDKNEHYKFLEENYIALDMAIKALEQEPCEAVAKERYEDLCEYFGGAKDILKHREDFKAWLGRVKWHIHKAEELSAENDDLRDQLAMRDRFQEQEPCEDAISREAVLKQINCWIGSGEYRYAMSERFLIDRIKTLPPVTPKPKTGWISVSERLPEDAYGCLVTVYDTDLRTQDEFENILPYFVGYDGETWNDADGEPISFEVIAWMPLPKPYKAESEK